MSDIKLKAASGGGSISLKGPSSAGSDTDFLDTSGNINVTGTSTFGGQLNVNTNSIVTSGWGAIKAPENQGFEINSIGSPNKYMISCKGGAAVYLYHNGTLQCETSAVGLKFPNGKGIDFSANTDGGSTSTSTLLEDYEEGTFTPTLGGQLSGQSYTAQTGQYTKVGNLVTCTVHLKLAGDPGSYSSTVKIESLPYTAANLSGTMGGVIMNYNDDWVHTSGTTGNFTGMVNTNENVLKFYRTSGDYLQWSNLDNRDAQFRCTIIYRSN